MQKTLRLALILVVSASTLALSSCGGGGNDGGSNEASSDTSSSSGSSSDSTPSSPGNSAQIFIPTKYTSATLTITCPNFEGTFELGRGYGGNNGTAKSLGDFKVLGTEKLSIIGTLNGSWQQESSTKGEFKLQLYGRYNNGAGRLDALDMILRHSAPASSSSITGSVVASGTVSLTLYNNYASGFDAPIPLQSGTFTLTYK